MKRPKRPRDPAQLAKLMIDIASGEVEDKSKPARKPKKRAVKPPKKVARRPGAP